MATESGTVIAPSESSLELPRRGPGQRRGLCLTGKLRESTGALSAGPLGSRARGSPGSSRTRCLRSFRTWRKNAARERTTDAETPPRAVFPTKWITVVATYRVDGYWKGAPRDTITIRRTVNTARPVCANLSRQAPGWRNVSGTRSRQPLRHLAHTEAVHHFSAALTRQAQDVGWEVVQLAPPQRASRYFRHGERLYSVRPDAFALLCRQGSAWPFFLEWEQRVVKPVTMAARLAPYLRYFSSERPLQDHGAQPAVLVVFDDELAATHFLRVAREEMERTGVEAPFRVSHRAAVEEMGPLDSAAWRTADGGSTAPIPTGH